MKSVSLFRPALICLTVTLALAACQSTAPSRQVEHRLPPHHAPQPAADLATANMSFRSMYAVKAIPMPSERIRLPLRDTERYGKIDTNPVQAVAQQPVSTFSIDVDTGSYANSRRFLNNGRLPPANAVRIEELVNYFDYDYPLPTDGKPFAIHIETVDSP